MAPSATAAVVRPLFDQLAREAEVLVGERDAALEARAASEAQMDEIRAELVAARADHKYTVGVLQQREAALRAELDTERVECVKWRKTHDLLSELVWGNGEVQRAAMASLSPSHLAALPGHLHRTLDVATQEQVARATAQAIREQVAHATAQAAQHAASAVEIAAVLRARDEAIAAANVRAAELSHAARLATERAAAAERTARAAQASLASERAAAARAAATARVAALPKEKECSVCLVGQSDTVLMPCRHQCVCKACAGRLLAPKGLKTCPICRVKLAQCIAPFKS